METYAILNEIELHLLCKVAPGREDSVYHEIHFEHSTGGGGVESAVPFQFCLMVVALLIHCALCKIFTYTSLARLLVRLQGST